MEDPASCSAAPPIEPGRAARGVESSRIAFTADVEHPERKVGRLTGLILAAMAVPAGFCQPVLGAPSPCKNRGVSPGIPVAPLPADMPGAKFSWFTEGFACGLSPEGSILASSTTSTNPRKQSGFGGSTAPSRLPDKGREKSAQEQEAAEAGR